METRPTIYLVDDDQAVRDSLKWLIESAGWLVQSYESAQPLLDELEAAQQLLSGCIIADVRLPGMSGMALQLELVRRKINLPFIIITGHGDVAMAVRAIKAGALDFIEKPFSDKLLLDRIEDAMRIDERRRIDEKQYQHIKQCYETLTAREQQVMGEVVSGKSNRQIATDLNVTQKTIEQHRAHVMTKMKADSLAHLVRMAVAIDVIPAPLPNDV